MREQRIREAQGEAQAILEVQKALADSLRLLNEAAPSDRVLALKGLEALEKVADGKATVVSSAWYTINGVRVAEPKQRGIYIRQDKMSDGTTRSLKVMVR